MKDGQLTLEPWAVPLPQGLATSQLEDLLLGRTVELEENPMGITAIKVEAAGDDRLFTMTDHRGPLQALASCGKWRLVTSDARPIYIMESHEQLVGTQRPFTTAAAYAWQGDTLALRMDWIDGGDNRRLWLSAIDGDSLNVIVCDNFDPLLNDTIKGIVKN